MILAADLHITKVRPPARTDDWLVAMDRKLRFILELALESPPLLVAGDIFDKPRPGDWVLRYMLDLIREFGIEGDDIIVVPGQHDLPYHSLDNMGDCGLGVLEAADAITALAVDGDHLLGLMNGSERDNMDIYGAAYGETLPDKYWNPNRNVAILLWHHMVISQPLWPDQQADKAVSILRKYPQFDLIVTGDNHQTFCIAEDVPNEALRAGAKYHPRWLVNPGSMMRRRTDQVNHKPCVFRWEPGRPPEQVFLPIDNNVLDLSVKEAADEKDERISGLIEGLKLDPELGVTFEGNMRRHLEDNDVPREVKDLIWEVVG